MISTTSILTNNHKNFEITQFFYSPSFVLNGKNISTFYGFLSFIDNKNTTILEGSIDDTILTAKCAVNENSDIIQILNRRSLTDFFKGQEILPTEKTMLGTQVIRDQAFPDGTTIISIDEEFLEVKVSHPSNITYIGNISFKGINQNDLISIKETPSILSKISSEENYYAKFLIDINVEPNVVDGLKYTRSIIGYNPKSKTIRVDKPFDSYPPITKTSTFKIYSSNIKPEIPVDSDKYLKLVHKNMYYMKKLTSDDFSPVIERINWKPNTYYAYYRDDIHIYEKNVKYRTSDEFSTGTIPCYTNDGQAFELNSYNLTEAPSTTFDAGIDIAPKYYFYVVNSFFQVFKCIWNNNGGKSTVEPYFIAGNFDDATNIFYDPEDGYKWKYMYTISGNKIRKFVDSKYIPVIVQDPIDIKMNAYGCGGIEAINITDGGSLYHDINNPISVIIEGDGVGAEAIVDVVRATGKIRNVIIKKPGKDYSYARISFSTRDEHKGHIAQAFASISPIGGSGVNAISELGCDKILVSCEINNSEDMDLPTDMQLRQYGIIVNPQAEATRPEPADKETYISCNSITVSPGISYYKRGEKIYQMEGTVTTYSGICVDFDLVYNKILVVNEVGTFTKGKTLYGELSGVKRNAIDYNYSEIIKYSGQIIQLQNFEEVQMSSDGISLFKTIINY